MNPAMAMMAMTTGKMAVMRLNASPAAKFMTQSLLNLVQKAWRVLKSFSAACLNSEVFCGSVPVFDAFVWVAITDPPHTIFHQADESAMGAINRPLQKSSEGR